MAEFGKKLRLCGARRRVVAACLMLGGALPCSFLQAKGVGINDPIFGLDYDPNFVHFPSIATNQLLPNCKDSLSELRPIPRAFTLYAKYQNGSTKVYIVGEPENIIIYVIRDEDCESGVPLLALNRRHHNPPRPGETRKISNTEGMGLFTDALGRYVDAFGGKARCFEWLDGLGPKDNLTVMLSGGGS